MKIVQLGALIVAPLWLLAGCSSSASTSGSGGASGTVGAGGSTASGGVPGSGGSASSGGVTGSGGSSGTGAASATGSGGEASGGTTGSGGGTTTGSGGRAGNGGGGRGATNSGGMTGTGGAGGASSTGGTTGAGGGDAHFSFFVASLAAMQELSGNPNGFGGDLRYGESTGLAGADKICATIAETSMKGAGAKTWHAFLSTVDGPVNAKDRVGQGPWYDRKGRLLASTLSQLLMARPADADAAIKGDLPNEDGIPNQNPDGTGNVDNHDILTGTGSTGSLYMSSKAYTCNDWTSSDSTMANMGPWVGHSWGAGMGGMGSGQNWMSTLREGGCGAGINLVQTGGPQRGIYTVGTGGGYGAIYCFALTP